MQGTVNVDVAPPVPHEQPADADGPHGELPPRSTPSSPPASRSPPSDPDSDPITYAWTQEPTTPAGTFSNTTVANPTWTAPRTSADTQFQLRVTVSDGKGGTATNTALVTVQAFVNSPPTLDLGALGLRHHDERAAVHHPLGARHGRGWRPADLCLDPDGAGQPVGIFSSTSAANPTLDGAGCDR